jgi:hypothetical protein
MSERIIPEIAVVGIDIGKTSFHVIGLDRLVATSHARCDAEQLHRGLEVLDPGALHGAGVAA